MANFIFTRCPDICPTFTAKMARVQEHLVEINRLENQGDRLLEQALAALYGDGTDLPALIEGLKWKEVYELLEVATDRAEDVADVLESIVLKNT